MDLLAGLLRFTRNACGLVSVQPQQLELTHGAAYWWLLRSANNSAKCLRGLELA